MGELLQLENQWDKILELLNRFREVDDGENYYVGRLLEVLLAVEEELAISLEGFIDEEGEC
jgi:hypothetical protein